MRQIILIAAAGLLLIGCDNIISSKDETAPETAPETGAEQTTGTSGETGRADALSVGDEAPGEPGTVDSGAPPSPSQAGDADRAVSAALPISRAVFDFMIEKEVTNRERYEAYAQAPHYGGGRGGVLIGFGYNVGTVSREDLWDSWGGYLGDAQLNRLERAIGVNASTEGRAAVEQLVSELSDIVVPWDAALAVYETKTLPAFLAQVQWAVPNTEQLHPHSLGALISLAYNRGSGGFRLDGDRYREMRAIRGHMESGAFTSVPAEFRSMKRLYTNERLKQRREDEAVFFERGLALQ